MATGTPADSERAEKFIRGQIDSVHWPADPPDPRPARRVEVGDVVWVYDFATREMAVHVVVGTDPDWEKGRFCGFHRMPISDSDSSRSPIPTDADHGFRHADRRFRHADHRFQGMSITDSGACRSPWSKRVAALENLT